MAPTYWLAPNSRRIVPHHLALGLRWGGLIVLIGVVLVMEYSVDPADKGFLLPDSTGEMSWPKKDTETVSAGMAFFISWVLPIGLAWAMALPALYKVRKVREARPRTKPFWFLFQIVFYVSYWWCISAIVVNVLKTSSSSVRPDWLARCAAPSNLPAGYYSSSVCTGDSDDVIQGRKGFPSGHAAAASFGMSVVVHLITLHHGTLLGKTASLLAQEVAAPIVQILCYSLALFVAASRYTDHKHNPLQIIVGLISGTFFGVCAAYDLDSALNRPVHDSSVYEDSDEEAEAEQRAINRAAARAQAEAQAEEAGPAAVPLQQVSSSAHPSTISLNGSPSGSVRHQH